MNKNEFGDVTINAQNSAFSVGSHNTVTNTNQFQQGLQDLTQKLLEELSKEPIPESQKQELAGTVSAVVENTKQEQPNRTLLSGMFGALKSGMEVFAKSPALIEAFTKWSDFISPLFG